MPLSHEGLIVGGSDDASGKISLVSLLGNANDLSSAMLLWECLEKANLV